MTAFYVRFTRDSVHDTVATPVQVIVTEGTPYGWAKEMIISAVTAELEKYAADEMLRCAGFAPNGDGT